MLRFVTSVEEFRAVFLSPAPSAGCPSPTSAPDAFLLCYESADGVTTDGLECFQKTAASCAERCEATLRLYAWDCSSPSFATSRQQLEKATGYPLLAVVFGGSIADAVREAPLKELVETFVPRMCLRLGSLQRSARPALMTTSGSSDTSPRPRALQVDVSKMVHKGKDLLSKGQAEYAEKFFLKALETLEVVGSDVARGTHRVTEYEGSVAVCLAWAALSQIVQGKSVSNNAYLTRLSSDRFSVYCAEPQGDASRVCATHKMLLAAPQLWTGDTCSQRKLLEVLQVNPTDHKSRSMLVITLFLAGDVERAMTEAIKLRSLQCAFGNTAIRAMVSFLGADHDVVRQLGALTTL